MMNPKQTAFKRENLTTTKAWDAAWDSCRGIKDQPDMWANTGMLSLYGGNSENQADGVMPHTAYTNVRDWVTSHELRYGLRLLKPTTILEYENDYIQIVKFEFEGDNDETLLINGAFVRYFVDQYNGAEFWGFDWNRPVVVKHEGNVVGYVMPMKP